MGTLTSRLAAMTSPHPGGCVLFTGSGGRYGRIRVSRQRTIAAHRLAWELKNGPVPDNLCVLHRCDVPRCVNVDHLFLGTQQENIRDMVEKERSTRGMLKHRAGNHRRAARELGERHAMAKLTRAQVSQIRALYVTRKFTQTELAGRFGVKQVTISRIVLRRNWVETPG